MPGTVVVVCAFTLATSLPQPALRTTSSAAGPVNKMRIISCAPSSQPIQIGGHIARLLVRQAEVRHRGRGFHRLRRTDPAHQVFRRVRKLARNERPPREEE